MCQEGRAYLETNNFSSALFKPSEKMHFMNELVLFHVTFDSINQM